MVRFILYLLIFNGTILQSNNWICSTGKVSFKSDAALELIEARTKQLKALLRPESGEFVFSLDVSSFEGFNSDLQREHFNENYLETSIYPKATFEGKMIERIDLSAPTPQAIRAKGLLKIHGVEQERIIKSTVTVKNGKLLVEAQFKVPLSDHNIRIPKVVHQKIAEEIQVEIYAELARK